ncbi:MAG TPA: hypothetical protein VGR41_01905 [Actinomycetota bacterium]|nr:hypothetical protein [Actinomycetota bacterium]
MEWYREVQFVAAVPMPPDTAEEFGTSVNGMWADPELHPADEVARTHERGRRSLFSVPMIALTPRVYEAAATAHLLDEVCCDADGEPSRCDWYYWETKPVYAACIYSGIFRRYLLDRCKDGVDRGMDVVNLDEIMTSVGLMNRDQHGSGFCARCLARFRSHLRDEGDQELAVEGDDDLRGAIRTDDRLYDRYRRFHEHEAFVEMVGFVDELRSYSDSKNPAFAISANVAYLGNLVPTFGALWGCLWGPHVDFVLMENHYRVEHDAPHLLLPRGTFAAWYRLGSSFTGAPTWICPSITVPRQLAGRQRTTYYLLMFLEAYANAGRWGYYWWPGVDVETRLAATAPEALKDYIPFIEEHRELYEDVVATNELAILYADGAISRRPETHVKYLALAQALAERGYQFDVVYCGDGRFNPDELDPEKLERYGVILLPEARELGESPTRALEAFARAGGELVVFSESPLDPELVRRANGETLVDFWRQYRDEDRKRILANLTGPTSARIEASDPAVGVIRYGLGSRQVLHLLDYKYEEATDAVSPIRDLRLRVPWQHRDVRCTLLAPGLERTLVAQVEDGALVVDVPELDPYAVLVVDPEAGR